MCCSFDKNVAASVVFSVFFEELKKVHLQISEVTRLGGRGVNQLTGSLTGLSRSLQFLPTGIGISTSRR